MDTSRQPTSSPDWDWNEVGDSIEMIDIGLSQVSESDGRLRFDADNTYIPRQTEVLVRCTLVDVVHGIFSPEDPTPCSLLVFDFQLDLNKTTRAIHRVLITLLFSGVSFKKIRAITPQHRLNNKPLDQERETEEGVNAEVGGDQVGGRMGGHGNKKKSTKVVKYASAMGWTQHYPKPRHNDPSPHDCVKWSILENDAEKDAGVPPHFRSAVLVDRGDEDSEFSISMEIDSKADLLTEMEDMFALWGKVPKGERTIYPGDGSTSRLKTYKAESLGEEKLDSIACLSLGKLAEKLFD